jgi:hypothetical protein
VEAEPPTRQSAKRRERTEKRTGLPWRTAFVQEIEPIVAALSIVANARPIWTGNHLFQSAPERLLTFFKGGFSVKVSLKKEVVQK